VQGIVSHTPVTVEQVNHSSQGVAAQTDAAQ
jgi:hypothetical protein